jgi:hypothetical protein
MERRVIKNGEIYQIKMENRAPRFRAYMDHKRNALYMLRKDWEQLISHDDEPIEIDISLTPLGSIKSRSKIVCAFAEYESKGVYQIVIFREDLNDDPKIINADKYEVWEDFLSVVDLEDTVSKCSTSIDTPFVNFIDDYVVILPVEKDADHHLYEIPSRYQVILKRKNHDMP